MGVFLRSPRAQQNPELGMSEVGFLALTLASELGGTLSKGG